MLVLSLGLSLACRPAPEPQHSGLAIGVSALEHYGLSTLWLELSGDTVSQAVVYPGLRLLSDSGPQHLREIAARATQRCAAEWVEDCAIHLSSVVPAAQLEQATRALQQEAGAQLGCTAGHTLERLRYATPSGYTTQVLDGGSTCAAAQGLSYETLSYASHPWGPTPLLPADALDALRAELLAAHPQHSGPLQADAVTLVMERAAGIVRARAAFIVQDGADSVELSVVISEETDATSLASLLSRWPAATDVMTAPGGEVAVVRLGSEALIAVRLADGAVLWRQSLPGRIVMAEWVTDPVPWRTAIEGAP